MTDALAKRQAVNLASAEVMTALRKLAVSMKDLDPNTAAALRHDMVKPLGKLYEELDERTRTLLLLKIQAEGKAVTEKGTMEVGLDGYTARAVPSRTGFDPKKVEALLRKRKLPLESCMLATITYKLDEARFERVVGLSAEDREACRYDKSWRLEVRGGGVDAADNGEG